MTQEEINALVTIALAGGKRRAHWRHKRYNSLEAQGLTLVINRGQVYHTHKLTAAGIEAVLALTAADARPIYPLPPDICKAQDIARGLKDVE